MNTDNYIKPKFNIMKNSKALVAGGIALILLSAFSIYSNRRYSIEFTGGLQMTLNNVQQPLNQIDDQVTNFLNSKGYSVAASDVSLGNQGNNTKLIVKTSERDEAKLNQLSQDLKADLIDSKAIGSETNIVENSLIGPSVGDYMKKSAINAIIWGVILIAIYVVFAFSGITKYIPSHLLGLTIITTLLFDVLVPAGFYGLLMSINPSYQIDLVLIISLLILMGYSVNDTIINFDRIRENINKYSDSLNNGKRTYESVFEMSLWQTMRRSIFTSLATLIAVVCMYVFGSGVLKNFGLVLMIGIICGTASSIFLAAPMAYLLNGKK